MQNHIQHRSHKKIMITKQQQKDVILNQVKKLIERMAQLIKDSKYSVEVELETCKDENYDVNVFQ